MATRSIRAERPMWEPAADLYETPFGWILKVELAGVHPDDIRIELQEGGVAISGVRRDWTVAEGWKQYSMEISYSRFKKLVHIPGLREASVSSHCRDGMLVIQLACKKGTL